MARGSGATRWSRWSRVRLFALPAALLQPPARAKVGPMSLSSAAGRLTAVLGPTNTGKTYLAIERMLGHESGMIGFPLRLLARANYDPSPQEQALGQDCPITAA